MIRVHYLNNSLEAATDRAGLNETRPRLMDFLKRIHARPAYRQALAKAALADTRSEEAA